SCADSSWCLPPLLGVLKETSRTRHRVFQAFSPRSHQASRRWARTSSSTRKDRHPMFDHPKNALSVVRTHQQELLQKEQMDRLAREARLWQAANPRSFCGRVPLGRTPQSKSTSVSEEACPSTGCPPAPPTLIGECARLEVLSHLVLSPKHLLLVCGT